MQQVFGFLTLLACGYALFIGVCAWHIARRLRRPPRRTYAWALSKGLPGDPGELRPAMKFEERTVEWRGVAIPLWDVAGGEANGPVVVLTPGWGDSRIGGLVRLRAIAPMCSRVILWDPPGLGASGAIGDAKRRAPAWSMGTRGHDALAAVLDEVFARGRLAPAGAGGERSDLAASVILFGWSAGAGTSIVAAARSLNERGSSPWRVAGVIAEAPYRSAWTPARNVILGAGLPWFLCGALAFAALGVRLGVGPRWKGFDRARHAAALKGRTPVLIIHGDADEVCPIADGRGIAGAAGATLVEIRGGRHNDLWTEASLAEASVEAVAAFVGRSASR